MDLGDFRPAGSDQAVETDDLAFPNRKRDVADASLDAHTLHAQDFLAPLRSRLRERTLEIAADHQTRHFGFARLRGCEHARHRSVAQDGDPLGEGEDFVHLVRDIDRRHASFLEFTDRREESARFLLRERRGGFVENHDGRLKGDRARDLDLLPLGDREGADHRGRSNSQLIASRTLRVSR